MKNKFKKYQRTEIAEMRDVTTDDIVTFSYDKQILGDVVDNEPIKVSISEQDLKNGSPKLGDKIARNPKNHKDQWLVGKKYFEDNFKEIPDKNKLKLV